MCPEEASRTAAEKPSVPVGCSMSGGGPRGSNSAPIGSPKKEEWPPMPKQEPHAPVANFAKPAFNVRHFQIVKNANEINTEQRPIG